MKRPLAPVHAGMSHETAPARLATRPGLRHTDPVKHTMPLALAFALLSALGCGPSATPAPQGPGPAPVARADDPTCPVLVAGTSVTVEDTDTGAALVFVTTGDVAAVRTRARALADAHNAHHAKMGSMPAPADGAPNPHAGHTMAPAAGAPNPHAGHAMPPAAGAKPTMGTMIGAHSTAAVTELPNGARVTFTARRSGRAAVRAAHARAAPHRRQLRDVMRRLPALAVVSIFAVGLGACAVPAAAPAATHPASPSAPTGRLAGAPAERCAPASSTYPDVPAARAARGGAATTTTTRT